MPETGYGRVAVMTSPRELHYAEYPLPAPGPGAILMKVTRANVCGSELHIWNGKHPVKKSGGLGHEMVGTGAALGERRPTDNAGQPLNPGDRIAATYFQTCDRCARCLGGQPNLCDNACEFFGKQPAEAPHFHVLETETTPVPERFSEEEVGRKLHQHAVTVSKRSRALPDHATDQDRTLGALSAASGTPTPRPHPRSRPPAQTARQTARSTRRSPASGGKAAVGA